MHKILKTFYTVFCETKGSLSLAIMCIGEVQMYVHNWHKLKCVTIPVKHNLLLKIFCEAAYKTLFFSIGQC